MNFENLQRAKALLSNRWIYGKVEKFEHGTYMIGDVNIRKETICSFTGFYSNMPWSILDNEQKKEFVNMLNAVCVDKTVTIDTAEQYWKGMPIFDCVKEE